MDDKDLLEDQENDEEMDPSLTPDEDSHVSFSCPKDGVISRDDVVFLCNDCENSEIMFKDGMYICPSCLAPGNNFQCMLCGSKEVTMTADEEADPDIKKINEN